MPLPANGTGSRPERDTVNTPTNQEGSAMHQPTSLGQLEVRTHDGQRFGGPTIAHEGALVILTRPAAAETARVGLDNVAEVIAR